MNPENENFDQLRRALALKRHEKPPPGYFDGFSSKVIARIASAQSSAERSWLERLAEVLTLRPAAGLAFGMVLCGLLGGSLLHAWREEPKTVGLYPFAHNPALAPGPYSPAALSTASSLTSPLTTPSSADSAVLASNGPPDFLFSPDGFFGPRPSLQPVNLSVRTN